MGEVHGRRDEFMRAHEASMLGKRSLFASARRREVPPESGAAAPADDGGKVADEV